MIQVLKQKCSLKFTLVLEEEMEKGRVLELMEFVVALAVKVVFSLFFNIVNNVHSRRAPS